MVLSGKHVLLSIQTFIMAVLIGISGLLIVTQAGDNWITLPVIPTLLIGLFSYHRLSKHLRWLHSAFIIVLVIVGSYRVGTHIAYTLETHEDNDFKHFWITSRIALQGQNIYDPENHHQVLSTLDSSEATDEFITRLVNTGFWYPPTSVLIFLPVGLFDLEMAWVINYIYLILFFLCTIRFLQTTFTPNTGLIGYGTLLAMTLLLWPTRITFEVSQTGFLLIVLTLFMLRHLHKPQAGLWAVLAFIVKPVMAPLALFFVLRKMWRGLGVFIAVWVTLSLLVLVALGPTTFFSYNPTGKIPLAVYTEPINQGLLARILHVMEITELSSVPIMHPVYVFLSVILAIITFWLAYRLSDEKSWWSAMLLLVFGLLVYPTTLRHYGILLILPALLVWKERETFVGGKWGAVAFVTLVCIGLSVNRGFYITYAILFCWIGLAYASFGMIYGESRFFSIQQNIAAQIRTSTSPYFSWLIRKSISDDIPA